ncbi:MAG: diacylglycerol kinase family protein [Chitinophagaceae bacterium]
MKKIRLLHNPTAGDEEHDKKELIKMVESAGYECLYCSVKKEGWDKKEEDTDLLLVAGGDGTVRKAVKKLLKGKIADEPWPPIVIVPLGTANNIATTLGVQDQSPEEVIASLASARPKKFDTGHLEGTGDEHFFLESFGYGIFPYLMMQMKKRDIPGAETPEESLRAGLEMLYQLILAYEPRHCSLQVDGADHSGKYIMAEVMNTRMLGPNIGLAMDSDPGDGQLEVVLIAEADKGKFAAFIMDKINDIEASYDFTTIRGRAIAISWDGTHVHTDDEVIRIGKEEKVRIQLQPGALEFLITGPAK